MFATKGSSGNHGGRKYRIHSHKEHKSNPEFAETFAEFQELVLRLSRVFKEYIVMNFMSEARVRLENY